MSAIEIHEPKLSRFLFANTRLSLFWLIIRICVGYQWVMAGWSKLENPMWLGKSAGFAIKNFIDHALLQNAGGGQYMPTWYSYFIQHVVLRHPVFFSYLVAYGEILVGVALILGLFTGIAALFGIFMNANYLFAGSISINPIMIVLELILILAWRTAGWVGLDRFILKSFVVTSTDRPAINKPNKLMFRNTI